MSVLRCKKDRENPYVQINKKMFEDINLSLKAKGLIGFCLMKPDDWKFYITQLCSVLKENKSAIYSAIQEMEEHGYCIKFQSRDEKGRLLAVDYIISDSKEEILRIKKELKLSLPLTDFPQADYQQAENQPLLIKNNTKERLEIKSSSSCLVSKEVPKKIDDDDDLRSKSFLEDSNSVEVTKTNGTKISMTQSEIYRYFSRKPEYTTDMIKEAIQKIRVVTGPINDILKYLEATCLSILKGSQVKTVYSKKELRPNETWGPIEKKPLISMGELMKQQELEEKNKRLGDGK